MNKSAIRFGTATAAKVVKTLPLYLRQSSETTIDLCTTALDGSRIFVLRFTRNSAGVPYQQLFTGLPADVQAAFAIGDSGELKFIS